MKWFRARIKQGSRLALFALLIQLVLTSGHIHLDAAHAAPAGSTVTSVQMPPDSGTAPAHQHHPADYCELCAVAALAGTMLFASPPMLQLPQAAEFLYRATAAEFEHLDSISGAPQPRGPPTS
jgi:hypothetical protein